MSWIVRPIFFSVFLSSAPPALANEIFLELLYLLTEGEDYACNGLFTFILPGDSSHYIYD
jgi:hypothetical protein